MFNKYEFRIAKKNSSDRLKYNIKTHQMEKKYSNLLMKFGIYWLQQGYMEFKKTKSK